MSDSSNITQFTGHENHLIPLADAAVFTANYRNAHPVGSIIGGFFGKDAINQILAQPGCVGIRYYYGINSTGDPVLVLVGADANMNDLVQGVVMEMSLPCPRWCSNTNPLNS